MRLFDELLNLFFPITCASCGNTLFKNEKVICTFCLHHLPKTHFHNHPNNPLEKVFWGRVPLQAVVACYYFRKEGKVQHLIHQLKYKNRKDVGLYIGKAYGLELLTSVNFKDIDAIIPVPLHSSKLKKRGFNQSEIFATGLSKSMKKPIDISTLIRQKASETQTRKSRFNRWENVKEIFSLNDANIYTNKHVLLVDDVITTGATIEACVIELRKTPGIKVSIAAIACSLN